MRNSDTITTITTNVGGRDFVINLRADGRFEVEGGLTIGSNWCYSFKEVREAIATDMEKSVERYGEPYMTNEERLAHQEAQNRAYENASKRHDAADRRATAAELGRIPDVYVFDGQRSVEEVKVRGVSNKRGYSSGDGFNVTILATGDKSQDRTVYRLTPALAAEYNKVTAQQAALEVLTEDIPSLQELDIRSYFEDGHWTLTVSEALSYYERRNRTAEAKQYAQHTIKFDAKRHLFIADNAIYAESLEKLTDRLTAMVHPSIGKWLVFERDSVVVAVEATVDLLTNFDRTYRYVEVVEDAETAATLIAQRTRSKDLRRYIDRIRGTIINHPSYKGLDRDNLANWPIIDVDILPEGGPTMTVPTTPIHADDPNIGDVIAEDDDD